MTIDQNISDLFFNTDNEGAATSDETGRFAGYDDAILRDNATIFLACLARLSVAVPSVDELLADFLARV